MQKPFNKTYHVLNGDCLAGLLKNTGIEGERIICREGLIDGDLSGDTLSRFWQARTRYMQTTPEQYQEMVVTEFEKIRTAPDHVVFNLWFGYDLFCQVNLWFVLSLLYDTAQPKEAYVVYPNFLKPEAIWNDFGNATTEDLKTAFENRIPFKENDFELARKLWNAYKTNDLPQLEQLSHQQSPCFPYLRAACKAHIDRFPAEGKRSRPEAVAADIIKKGTTDFNAVFEEFFKREGLYGFGDVQFKKIYDAVMPAG